jgi:Peroxisomal biogenesis factor 11 (PEX11)
MMLVQYSIDIVTHHLNIHSLSRLQNVLVRYVPLLPPVHPSIGPSPLSTRLKALSALLADARILLRLHGIIPTYQWLLNTHASPPANPTIAAIVKLQTYANMLYYPLENAAYLASHNVVPLSKQIESDLWIWSSRFWAAHVFLDLARLYYENRGRKKLDAKSGHEGLDRQWLASVIMNCAYAPLTIHWSLEKGLGFRDVDIGYFGIVAAIASIYLAWPS